jgi:ribosome-associated protein
MRVMRKGQSSKFTCRIFRTIMGRTELSTQSPAETAPRKRLRPSTPASAGLKTEQHTLVLGCLDDAKAEDTILIDLKGKSALADHMVIATGRSDRHVGAIADQVMQALKKAGVRKIAVEGVPLCEWVLIDTGDIIVHIFKPDVRAFYNLEKLWSGDRPEEKNSA